MPANPDSSTPVFTAGRLVLWLVLTLMAVSIGYSVWIAIENWTSITV